MLCASFKEKMLHLFQIGYATGVTFSIDSTIAKKLHTMFQKLTWSCGDVIICYWRVKDTEVYTICVSVSESGLLVDRPVSQSIALFYSVKEICHGVNTLLLCKSCRW